MIPPYEPSERETTGKMISPPEELTLIPKAEFFWLLQEESFDIKSKELSFSNLFEFPSQSNLYWRLMISRRVDRAENMSQFPMMTGTACKTWPCSLRLFPILPCG